MSRRWLSAVALVVLFGLAATLWVLSARQAGQGSSTTSGQAGGLDAGSPSVERPPQPAYQRPPPGPATAPAYAQPVAPTRGLVRCATHPLEQRPPSEMVRVMHKGKTYYVCCDDCAAKFRADPEFWIRGLRQVEEEARR